MNIKDLKDKIKDLPDDMRVVYWVDDRSKYFPAWNSETATVITDSLNGRFVECFNVGGPV